MILRSSTIISATTTSAEKAPITSVLLVNGRTAAPPVRSATISQVIFEVHTPILLLPVKSQFPSSSHPSQAPCLRGSIVQSFTVRYLPKHQICKKPFKRPQDLKKHEKIHTEEHHAQHKHSKAITVNDPAYISRVRGDSVSLKGTPNRPFSGKLQGAAHGGALPPKVPFARTRPRSGVTADGELHLIYCYSR
jgi:hypothetical protein